MDQRLEQQLNFIIEMDQMKHIVRQTPLADGSRKENDAEHSWHIAVMAILLQEYASEPIDILKVTKMLLLHDIVEIDAGDTYAYDLVHNGSKTQRENDAADRLYAMLPEDQKERYRALWDEFELQETPEARYALAIDRLQPLLLNHVSEGISWVEHNVQRSAVEKRNEDSKHIAPALYEIVEEVIAEHVERGTIGKG